MKMNKVALSFLAVCIGFSGYSLASEKDYSHYESGGSEDDYKGYEKYKKHKDHYKKYHPKVRDAGRLALNLVGKGNMYEKDVPDLDGDKQPDPASCFDVELKDIEKGRLIGTATDCLSEVMEQDGGIKLIGTTFFNLPGGQIVTRGLTTVQPVLQDTVTPDGVDISHITGASSDKNSIIKATGKYKGHIGTVRLSGMVNLDEFTGEVGTPIFFDCLFIIDLKEIKFRYPHHWYKWYKEHYYQDFYKAHYGIENDEPDNSYEDTGDSGESYEDTGSGGESYEDTGGTEEPYEDTGDSGESYEDTDSGGESYVDTGETQDPYEDSGDSYRYY
ncbi:hypothetical protein C942_01881 [Photobacterium marinum]|uniref:PRC-barrel domain-containing protein n=1 Tax=Photobacterium marinum TaxID=1056511 RepID=L8J9D5_9GAMM|nr:hypothetical protein [Photobacterium marinum]ELR64793.1 hypothetical protein C942_01881 [Photobacterium marinum]